MTDNDRKLAEDYAKRIARDFYDADEGARFGYRDEADSSADTLAEVLDAADIPEGERDDYDRDSLPDGWRIASAADYLSDALDFRYVVDSSRSYRHGEICIGLGGPNVWITTEDAKVTVYWGSTASANIPTDVAADLDEALCEFWEIGS